MTRWILAGTAVLFILALAAYGLIRPAPLGSDADAGERAAVSTASEELPPSPAQGLARDVAAAPPGSARVVGREVANAARPGAARTSDPLLAPEALIAREGSALAKQEARQIFLNPRPERRAAAVRERARKDREGLALSARSLALSDASPEVRAHAVEALGLLGEEEALQEILEAEEADEAVREKAQVALDDAVGFARLEGLPVSDLIPYMRDAELWWHAMELVAAANDPSVAGELWDIYFDTGQGYERREYALFVLDDLEIEIDEPLEALWIEEEQAELQALRQSGALN